MNQVGLKRFDLMGCRVELRSEEKATSKGYRPRFKLVHPDRTLTFEVPSNGVPFAEIKEAVAAWSAVLMSAIEKANMGAEGAALRAAQSRSPEEAAALAARLMSQYDPDFAPQFDVDEDDDFHDATADSLQDTVTAVFECDGALGMSLVAQEIRSNELPPGWSQTQEEDGRVVYLMPGGEGRQYQRPKANEHQCVQIQSISQNGLVGTGQYFEKNSSQVDFLQVGMVLDALNGESVAGVSFKKIMQSIKAAGRPVELTFHMPIDGQVETLTPRKRDALQSFGERDGGLEAAPARSAAQFNRTVGPKTVEASAQSSMVSVSAQSPRRVRAETAGPADYDDPKDEAAGASDDDDYVDASTQLQSFRSLQGSAEMLVSKLKRMLLPAAPHLARASCCPACRLLCCGVLNAMGVLHHCRTKRLRCFTLIWRARRVPKREMRHELRERRHRTVRREAHLTTVCSPCDQFWMAGEYAKTLIVSFGGPCCQVAAVTKMGSCSGCKVYTPSTRRSLKWSGRCAWRSWAIRLHSHQHSSF
eukprot:COSAG02_NODE_8086_length_2716_cov_2.370653_1_plen_531_part_00